MGDVTDACVYGLGSCEELVVTTSFLNATRERCGLNPLCSRLFRRFLLICLVFDCANDLRVISSKEQAKEKNILQQGNEDTSTGENTKTPTAQARVIAERLESLASLGVPVMAMGYASDAAGILSGIATGTISNGQPRLAESLIAAYKELIASKVGSNLLRSEELLLVTIHECAALGFSIADHAIGRVPASGRQSRPSR